MVDAAAKLIARANEEVLDPLSDLADAMINLDAFCGFSLPSDFARARAISRTVEKSHGVAIRMVRAGILRADWNCHGACLDPFDPRGNRASVGQILGTLKDPALR